MDGDSCEQDPHEEAMDLLYYTKAWVSRLIPLSAQLKSQPKNLILVRPETGGLKSRRGHNDGEQKGTEGDNDRKKASPEGY